MKGRITMIRENALGKKNSCQCVGLRYIGKFLLPIVSVCCMQAWAEEFELVSASGATKEVTESGTYTAPQDQDLTFGALQVAATPVTFDFSATPTRKVVFDGSSQNAFVVNKKNANVIFKGGEWGVAEGFDGSFYCSSESKIGTKVFLDNCVWTNLYRVYVGRSAEECALTLDNNSRVYAQQFFLMYGGRGGCVLNILGGSGLFLSSDDTPFYTDNRNSSGLGKIIISGDGSILSAPNSDFRVGNSVPNHLLVVSNNASLVANKFIIGNNVDATGSQVLVADDATFTAKEISIRNPGCGMTVSNATLAVDSTANDAIKVGYEGRTGGSFVLSGADAQINYAPSGNVEVFAENGGGAEFRIENGASWAVGANQIAGKTSNSVFRIGSGGMFKTNGRLQFGPSGDDNADPAHSLSNRLEVCSGGVLEFDGLRFSGNGNALVVSNGTVSCGQIQLGYNRPNWKTDSKVTSRDCALVLSGENGRIVAEDSTAQIQNGSVVRFEVPENGYAANIVPLKVKTLSFAEGTSLEVDCKAFWQKSGGKLVLAEMSTFAGDTALVAANETLPEGCTLTVENKSLVLRCPRRRFVFSIR